MNRYMPDDRRPPTSAHESLADLTVTQARAAIIAGELEPGEYHAALARVSAGDAASHRAIVTATSRSEAHAGTGPLAGIPLVVKDNIDVRGEVTSAGTPGLLQNVARRDAPVVARLLQAGATITGKTGLHELALGATSNNPFQGVAGNPWDHRRIPGGSSGGTAVAVACGHAPAGLGTDTGGSVRIPAALCGIFGFRPSVSRYPAGGVVSLSPTRDAVGPMARSVDDILLLDSILAGVPVDRLGRPDRIRLGIVDEFIADLDPDVEDAFAAASDSLRAAGAELVRVTLADVIDGARSIAAPIVLGEANAGLEHYLQSSGEISLSSVLAAVQSHDVQVLADRFADGARRGLTAELERRDRLRADLLTAASGADVMAFVYPTVPAVAPLIGDDDMMPHVGRNVPTFETLIRHGDLGGTLGMTGISIPLGLGGRTGLPVGMEIAAPDGGDDAVLALAVEAAPVIARQIAPTAIRGRSKGVG
jgi:mandelamide amidase